MSEEDIVEETLESGLSIKDILKELKTLSSLIVQMAYAALLFNNDEIAREVKEITERIEELRNMLEIRALMSSIPPEEAGDMLTVLRAAEMSERIAEAAENISELMLESGADPHPVLQQALVEATETVALVRVDENAPCDGKLIREFRPGGRGLDIIAIKRGKKWIHPVRGDQRVKAGDLLLISASPENLKRGIYLFRKKRRG